MNKSITVINNQIEKKTEKIINRDGSEDGGVAGIVSIKGLIKTTDDGMNTMEAMIKTMGINVDQMKRFTAMTRG